MVRCFGAATSVSRRGGVGTSTMLEEVRRSVDGRLHGTRWWSRGIMLVTRRDGVENRAAASGPAPPTVQAGRMREQARPSLQAKRDQTGKVRKGGTCLVLPRCSRGFHDTHDDPLLS